VGFAEAAEAQGQLTAPYEDMTLKAT